MKIQRTSAYDIFNFNYDKIHTFFIIISSDKRKFSMMQLTIVQRKKTNSGPCFKILTLKFTTML